MGEEDFRHVGEQERAVDGGDFDGVPVGVVFFGGNGEAWRDRHVAAAAGVGAAVACRWIQLLISASSALWMSG